MRTHPSYPPFWSPECDTAECLADQFELKETPHSFAVVSFFRIIGKVGLSPHAEEV